MSTMATYRGVKPVTIIAGASALALGVRVSINTSGTCDAQDATKRGDYITMEAIPAGKTGCAVKLTDGEVIALNGATAVAAGDDTFAAAAGGFAASGSVYVGKWREAVAAGAQGSLLIKSVS